ARATARTRCTTGTGRAALAGGTAGGLLGAAGTRRALTGAGHALRAGEGVVPGTGTARTGTALARLAAGTGHALRAGEGVVARTGAPRARRGTLTAGLRGGDRLLGTRLRGGRRGSRLRGRGRLLGAGLRCGGRLLGTRLRRGSRLLGIRRLGARLRGGGGRRGGSLGLLRSGLRTGLGGATGLGSAGGGRAGAALLRGSLVTADGGELLTQTAGYRSLDGRGGGANEFAHVLQLLQNDLARVSELLGELVDADLSHISPVSVRPTRGLGPLIPEGAHG